MTLVVCWLAFPLLFAALALGAGLALERVTGTSLSGALLVPTGLAVMVVLATALMSAPATAPLATYVLIAVALGGVVLGRARLRRGVDGWLVGTAVLVFGAYGAPVLLSGQATFAGYTRLDDISTFLALTAHLAEHGRSLSGLPVSTYARTLTVYLGEGYPVGSLTPLGALRPLVRQDLAWLFAPYLTMLGVVLALGLWALLEPVVSDRRLRCLAVVIASQPALLYGHALEGAVKELMVACLLPTAVLLALASRPAQTALGRARAALAPLVAVLALIDAYGAGAAAWLGPLVVAVLIGWAIARRRAGRQAGRRSGRGRPRTAVVIAGLIAGLVGVALVFPALGFQVRIPGELRSATDIGNLAHPLSALQIFGVWPTGDFRTYLGGNAALAALLIGAVAVGAVVGLRAAISARAVALIAYVGVALVAAAAVAAVGGPWVTAKAMAISSPALLTAWGMGLAHWQRAGRRWELAAALAVAGGVLWSNVLAYHDVALAPRDHLVELAGIARRLSGQGPTLINEYEPYAARYFLRRLDAESPSELRYRAIPLLNGQQLGKDGFADLDTFQLSGVLVYRTIILRRSPSESRPPSVYRLVASGRYYDVWQRPLSPPVSILVHRGLGSVIEAAAVPSDCSEVRALSRFARRAGGQLLEASAPVAAVFATADGTYPAGWSPGGGLVFPRGAGTVALTVQVPGAGRYAVWVGGDFARGVDVSIDHHDVGTVRYELGFAGQQAQAGQITLTAGAHRLWLRYPGGDLRPGSGLEGLALGPVSLVPVVPSTAPSPVTPAQVPGVCSKPLDWLEVVRREPGSRASGRPPSG